MKQIFQKHHRAIFYSGWFLLGLLQCIFTELQDDEAYYWVFSAHLDWGYFDHPPMIALLVKMGAFLSGELGVRFFSLVLNTATIFITEKLTERKNAFLFYAIVLSVAVLQVGGFMAVPDTPLMFFTALFFLTYRNYLQQASWRNVLLLGLVAACLLYSKYHAVLLFLLVLMSNWKLLKDAKIYTAGVFALLLFVPHLYWQYQHNWISFRYHLFESNVNPYKFSYTTDYVLGQLLIAGPFVGFLLWPIAFLYKSNNRFERSLIFTAIGVFVFFFLSTFKGKVEPNWTSPAIVPLIVLAHQYLLNKAKWQKWVFRLLPVTLVLVAALRVVLMVNLLPVPALVERYHSWKGWPQEMKQKTGGLPAVFNSSYQQASKYAFYTGVPTYSLNKIDMRRNNYNFWPIEDSLLGKPVYLVNVYGADGYANRLQTSFYTIGYMYDSSYHSFSKITFKAEEQTIRSSDSLTIDFIVEVPAHYKAWLAQHLEVDQKIVLAFSDSQKMLHQVDLPFTLRDVLNKNIRRLTAFPDLPAGEYFMRFGVASSSGMITHNSEKIKLKIETPNP